MAVNAFLTFFDKADGESTQKGKEKWVEISGWDWEVEAVAKVGKGLGARVGKATPGKLSFEHYYDTSSAVLMGSLCTGRAFPKVELQMTETTGAASADTYFSMLVEGAHITKVSNSGTEEGNVIQKVAMVFKTVTIGYQPQDAKTGKLGAAETFTWDIPSGSASPSS